MPGIKFMYNLHYVKNNMILGLAKEIKEFIHQWFPLGATAQITPYEHIYTYDVEKLQESGDILPLDDISACPNCKSKKIRYVFYIPVNVSDPYNETICQDCGYKDKIGEFQKTNQILSRENKINQILK